MSAADRSPVVRITIEREDGSEEIREGPFTLFELRTVTKQESRATREEKS